MKNLEKLMQKKKDGQALDPTYKKAKMSMLQALQQEMSNMMRDDLKNGGMKKVEVAGNDKEALAHGLDKAKEMIGSGDEADEDGIGDSSYSDDDSDGVAEHEGLGGEDDKEPAEKMIADQIEHEGAEHELSDEDIDELMHLLQEMKMKKGM